MTSSDGRDTPSRGWDDFWRAALADIDTLEELDTIGCPSGATPCDTTSRTPHDTASAAYDAHDGQTGDDHALARRLVAQALDDAPFDPTGLSWVSSPSDPPAPSGLRSFTGTSRLTGPPSLSGASGFDWVYALSGAWEEIAALLWTHRTRICTEHDLRVLIDASLVASMLRTRERARTSGVFLDAGFVRLMLAHYQTYYGTQARHVRPEPARLACPGHHAPAAALTARHT
jgi:hypothetical protein